MKLTVAVVICRALKGEERRENIKIILSDSQYKHEPPTTRTKSHLFSVRECIFQESPESTLRVQGVYSLWGHH